MPPTESGDRRPMALIVVAAIVAPIAIVAFLGIGLPLLSLSYSWSCSPPTPAQLETQRTFVLAHLPAAADLEVGHQDCDDQGEGYVDFKTDLTPAAARDRFLSDAACSSYSDQGEDDTAVACISDGFRVYVFFERSHEGHTDGELTMERV